MRLTNDQKRAAAREALRANPDRSDRAIGRQVGCDGKTVASVRAELRNLPAPPKAPSLVPDANAGAWRVLVRKPTADGAIYTWEEVSYAEACRYASNDRDWRREPGVFKRLLGWLR
jgi:hypothetical protein